MSEQSFFKKFIKVIAKSVSGKYLLYITQLLSLAILARIFTPEQFGYIAAVQVFSTFFILLSEVGVGPAFINKDRHSKSETDGIFSVTALIGIVVGLAFAASAPLIADFYNDSVYTYIVLPVSLAILFSSLSIIPTAALQIDCKFLTIARCEIKAEVLSLIFTLILMNYIEPLIALSLKVAFFSLFKFVFLWHASKRSSVGRAAFNKHFSAIKPLLNFSMYQFGFNFVNFFSRNLDNILVGKYIGATSLGIYDQAYRLMRYPLMLLTFAISPAIQPMMKTIANDKQQFLDMHNKFFNYLSLVGLVIGGAIFLFSDLIVLVLLGEGWEKVGDVIKLLSLSIPVQVVMSTSGGFFQAADKVSSLFVCGVITALTNVTSIILGVQFESIIILSLFISISFQLNFYICYYIFSKKVLSMGFLAFLNEIKLFLILNAFYVFLILYFSRNLYSEVLF